MPTFLIQSSIPRMSPSLRPALSTRTIRSVSQNTLTSWSSKVDRDSVQAMLSSIDLSGNSWVVEMAYSSSPLSQSQKCWKFGQVKPPCKADHFTSPLCSLQHTKAEHRCPNPSCPKKGNLKPLLNCCLTLLAKCPNSREPHPVRSRDYPERPPGTMPRRESTPEGTQALRDTDRMDDLPDTPPPPATPFSRSRFQDPPARTTPTR